MTFDDPDFPEPPIPKAALQEARDRACVEATITLQAISSIISPDGAAWGAYDWLQTTSYGLPYVSMIEEAARDDARFWAETASPAELECYALAALDKLATAPFASRQIKRMIAALWGRMSPNEQQAFKAWIGKTDG